MIKPAKNLDCGLPMATNYQSSQKCRWTFIHCIDLWIFWSQVCLSSSLGIFSKGGFSDLLCFCFFRNFTVSEKYWNGPMEANIIWKHIFSNENIFFVCGTRLLSRRIPCLRLKVVLRANTSICPRLSAAIFVCAENVIKMGVFCIMANFMLYIGTHSMGTCASLLHIIIIIKPLLKIFNECRSLTGVGELNPYWRSSMNVEV